MNSDWEEFLKAQSGDQKAWRLIFKKYNKFLLRFAFLILGSFDRARDIVQETFIRLSQTKPRHFEGNFKSYLTVIAYRLAMKEKRRLKIFTKIMEDQSAENANAFLEDQIETETQRQIYKIISELSDDHRDILILRFYGGQSYEGIAETLNIPIGTVKSRMFYAVKSCQKKLREKGIL